VDSGIAAQGHDAQQLCTSSTDTELRVYSRKYSKLQQQVTRVPVGMDTVLIMCGIRASSCLSRLTTKSYLLIVEAAVSKAFRNVIASKAKQSILL
jgi:hypothetical protein